MSRDADDREYNPALDTNRTDDTPPRSGVGSFGQVVFQVSEESLALVRDVRRKTAARTEEHKVVGAKPRLEFIAAELSETSFEVFWNVVFGLNPRAEIRRLRELCEQGAAFPVPFHFFLCVERRRSRIGAWAMPKRPRRAFSR